MDKCLAFCQGLAMSNKKFTFSLSIGKDTLNFENKELVLSSCPQKKKSPSQLRRELRRKKEQEFKKTPKTTEKEVEVLKTKDTDSETAGKVIETKKVSEKRTEYSLKINCSQCDLKFKNEKGLNIHIGKAHKAGLLPTPEEECSTSEGDGFRKSGASIPQVDGTSDQDIDKKKEVETLTEEVKEPVPVLRDWDEEIRRNPDIEDLHCLHTALSEPPPRVFHPVHGIGVFEKVDCIGQFVFKFSDGRSRAC